MNATLDDYLEDSCIACESCSGEANLLINVNGELRCIQCLNGKAECA